MTECRNPIEFNVGGTPQAITFSTNGEYLWSGSGEEVQVWRLEDEQQTATMKTTHNVLCLALSKNGKWAAAGTMGGYLSIWDAETYELEQVIDNRNVNGVDFSPDSTRLIMVSGSNKIAMVWEMETREKVQTLPHNSWVRAAKYSQKGDCIATATDRSVRLWGSSDARLLVNVEVEAISPYNSGLVWSADHLFVISDHKIKQFEASTGSLVLEWPVPNTDAHSSITLPSHGKFIACSTGRTISLWDMALHMQPSLIRYHEIIRSIAISPDDGFIAAGSEDGKIMINKLCWTTEPDIQIDDAVLEAWKHDRLVDAEALLTAEISESRNPRQHALASRALVRARLEYWDAAIIDAIESIKIRPSVIGYVAKSVALVGKRERHKAYRACDTALAYSNLTDVRFLLLIKAIIVFIAGEHDDAISRVDDLIDMIPLDSTCYVVQAYMFLVLGNLHMQSGDYTSATKLFERARAQIRPHSGQTLMMVSLMFGWKFDSLDITTRQGLCEALYLTGRIREAGEFLLDAVNTFNENVCITQPIATWISNFLRRYQMNDELAKKINTNGEQPSWVVDFRQHCARKLEHLGDIAMGAQQYDEAITFYSTTLSLDPFARQDVLIKRSKVQIAKGFWESAIDDTNQAIMLNPSFPWAYENKQAALHGAGRYDDAIHTFQTMLLKISQSPDPDIRNHHRRYVTPEQTKAAIRAAVDDVIRESPLVLINTDSGRLLDKSGQASSFETQPIYRELISAMSTHIDHARIEREVSQYYRYATLSHKWEENEPLFENVVRIVVYDLQESLTHNKLQMFCKIVQALGFHWAWSDTCCINKADHFVLQEALVAMFKWYEGSATTIVLLRGVRYPPKRGDLMKNVWNTRAWTLQEYHASKVVRFYTEDWKPYLSPDIPNHKESLEIIAEMEEATGVSSRALMALRPGLDDIREKLRLASTRQMTRVEDAAYSLLGIFSMSMPVVYGEGDKALGRFLAQLLTSSGDTSILAWTGRPGSFSSCLPASVTVFNQPPTVHIPLALAHAAMDKIITKLRSSPLSLTSIVELCDRLHQLHVPFFVGQRMKLPCIMFKLGPLSDSRSGSRYTFRAQTGLLGVVEFTTGEHLSQLASLYLVHPWIDFLLDRQPVGSVVETISEESVNGRSSPIGELLPYLGPSDTISSIPRTRAGRRFAFFPLAFSGRPVINSRDAESLRPPSTVAEAEKRILALQVIARLRQPFGALLLTPHLGRVAAYRRVAADSQITVQVEEITQEILSKLVDSVRTLDIL